MNEMGNMCVYLLKGQTITQKTNNELNLIFESFSIGFSKF